MQNQVHRYSNQVRLPMLRAGETEIGQRLKKMIDSKKGEPYPEDLGPEDYDEWQKKYDK